MNVMTFNSCGLGARKCKAISKLCNKHNISFLGIQKTHYLTIDPFKVKCLWGNFQFEHAVSPSVGRSGGILSVWDTTSFSKLNVFPFENCLIIEGRWLYSHLHCYMVNVYASQDDRKKETLWNQIIDFKEGHLGHYIVFRDFNVVRSASERTGTIFNPSSANAFNQFISDGHLWEIPHGGHLFTRINRSGNKLSKLDRFLVTEISTSHFRNHSAQVLDCYISDHRPIVLSAFIGDFGPSPFKFYNSWLLDKHLCTIISDFWIHNSDYGSNPLVAFKNKMKTLKNTIKDWSQNRKSSLIREKEDLLNMIKDIDVATARGSGNNSLLSQRPAWLDKLRSIELEEHLDISQKAKVRWGIEADENTKFFHAIVNQKRITLSIHGIKHEAFVHEFFKTGFIPKGCNTSFIALIPKNPNPMVMSDFRPISLISAQYKIIAKIIANRLAQVIDLVISKEQTAFIKHRQILDGPLMVNEVIKWCNRKKDKLMIFKIDFEKAFDSVSWDYLLQVMHFMGFCKKWISWTKGCLFSATASVLVNGSPTCEYSINCGLRQGDPLSPFLFIIAMEGLHVAVKDAISVGLYKGIKVNNLTISHFFFADDALFLGEWSRSNIKSIAIILDCFHKVSGLKINFHKSNLIGIGVPNEEVNLFSQATGCNDIHSSFMYLGLPVNCNMAFSKSWDPILDKFSKRLSKWKASLLSIGGRCTLISSILGAIGTYYFSLFPMPAIVNKNLETLHKGGLGIGSLYSLNHALIQKWRWRFFNNPHALWVQVIKAIHGDHGVNSSFYSHVRDNGVWGCTLISSILGAIGTYYFSLFPIPAIVNKNLETLRSNFFWGSNANGKKFRGFHGS
nr:RNA-directed DNA polymerase, eukaryota, reverse transcriptase zinc-binding domain protein [Tanacetum cinerariifolium]